MAGARSVTFAVDVDAPILQARHPVIGDALSGVTDTGSEPVKIGGKFTATKPTFADGQRGDLQIGSRGELLVGGLGASGAAILGNPNLIGAQDSAGNLAILRADVLADAIVNRAALYALAAQMLYNGTTWDRARGPIIFKPFATTAITAGTGATVWTPAAGKKFRLMGWLISSSVAGQLIFGDNLVGTVIARSEAVAAAGVSKEDSVGNGFLSALANNVLKLDGPTGNVAGMVWGTEE